MPTVTVALTDIPAFSARFGVSPCANGKTDSNGLPDWDWLPDPHQTPEQAQAWNEWVAGGAGLWRPAGVAGTGIVASVAGQESKPLETVKRLARK